MANQTVFVDLRTSEFALLRSTADIPLVEFLNSEEQGATSRRPAARMTTTMLTTTVALRSQKSSTAAAAPSCRTDSSGASNGSSKEAEKPYVTQEQRYLRATPDGLCARRCCPLGPEG